MYLKKVLVPCIIIVLSSVGCAAKTSSVAQLEKPTQTANTTLAEQMKIIGASYKAFNSTEDQAEALKALVDLRTATELSKHIVPTKVASSSTEVTAYQADLDAMLAIIEQSISLVKQDQLAAAKTLAQQLNDLKDIAHPRYR